MFRRENRPTFPAVRKFPIGNFRSRERRKRRAKHAQTQLGRRAGRVIFQRRLRRGNENYAIEPKRFARRPRQRQMRRMRRVKTSAENSRSRTPKQRLAARGNGIRAARRQRRATQNSPRRKQRSREKTVFEQRLSRVFRTRRRKAAKSVPAENCMQRRRNNAAVKRDDGKPERDARTAKNFPRAQIHRSESVVATESARDFFFATPATMRRAASK